nr:hypothetical protein GCM10025732_52220 [Glycomyces mayteni]
MIVTTTARPDEFATAAEVLAEAFLHDPVARSIVPADADRRERLAHLFTAVLRSGPGACGVVDVARREHDERIIGVAAWEAPEARQGRCAANWGNCPDSCARSASSGSPARW